MENHNVNPVPPSTPVDADLVAFWADQLAGLAAGAREGWLFALSASHGCRFAEHVREVLAREVAA